MRSQLARGIVSVLCVTALYAPCMMPVSDSVPMGDNNILLCRLAPFLPICALKK